MKTSYIVALLMMFFVVIGSTPVSAQEDVKVEKTKKELRKEKKAKKKAQREAENNFYYQKALKGLEENKWVLEAHTLYAKRGRSIPVTSTTNFVAMDGEDVFVQLSFDGFIGPNGLGGITLKGRPTKHELTIDDKGNVMLRMSVIGTALTADIIVRMTEGGNYATAEVSSITRSHRLEFSGVLMHKNESTYYKSGMDL